MQPKKGPQLLTDLIAVKRPLEGREPYPPNPGTVETRAIETVDNDRESWFLGVLPPG